MTLSGIIQPTLQSLQNAHELKRLMLLFDNLVVEEDTLHFIEKIIKPNHKEIFEGFFSNIEFLANKDLLSFISLSKDLEAGTEESKIVEDNILIIKFDPKNRGDLNTFPSFYEYVATNARAISIKLSKEGKIACPVFSQHFNRMNLYNNIGNKNVVLNFVLSKFPIPAESNSWEQIFDFKNDLNTKAKYYALRNWVNEISKKNFELQEIEDKFNYLYNDYLAQFSIHKMKYSQSTLDIIVTTGIDIVSGGLGFNSIKTSLFSLWKNELNLLEAESNFNGREIAYIYQANSKFGSKKF